MVREGELRELRAGHAVLREEGDATVRALVALAEELEAVRRQARGQATRIRLSALREAAAISGRIAELSGEPGEVRRELVAALLRAIERVGVEEDEDEAAGDPSAGAPDPDAELFDGEVEVEIGPLSDFSQLVGFEDAAKSIAATDQISIKRFSEGRATMAVQLSQPVALLRELEERCDLDFRVRDLREDRLILDVGQPERRD